MVKCKYLTIGVGLAIFTAALSPIQAAGLQQKFNDSKEVPGLNLGRVLAGEEAIQALGNRLVDVAEAHKMTEKELRRVLQEDRHAKIDRRGRLFFTEPDLEAFRAGGLQGSPEPAPQEAVIPLQDTFLLHSKPGAAKLIYLDFDGHYLSGTAWNAGYNNGAPIPAPPWDIDGNPSSFGDNERTIIQQIWQRVAEDYEPFNVDVTTEYPGEAALTRSSSSDTAYGARILISPIGSYFGGGGIAYVSSFDDVGDYYKPALVFPERLGNSAKNVAEAISHEGGHTLGLTHDGTTTGTQYYAGHGSGQTGWAPIMGVGYYQNLSQWSSGAYPNANNKQDDLAIISTFVGYAADDYGNDASLAAVFPAGPTLTAVGTIERNTDTDVFRFSTGAGGVSLSLVPADFGPNLDLAVSLRDSAGSLVASANPVDGLGASISAMLNAGTYFVHVNGVAKGDPLAGGYPAYGSLGQYTLTGTVIDATGAVPPTAIVSAIPTSGYAPLPVQFSSSGSTDPDGSIVSYSWNFGDQTSSIEANPLHTYATAGTYVATLTVTDNTGLQASAGITIQAQQPVVLQTVRASSVQLSVTRQGAWKTGVATVQATDLNNQPVIGASISGAWSGVVTGVSTGTTDVHGVVRLNSPRSKQSGTATFTITNISRSGYSYDPSRNVTTSASTTF